MKLKSEGKSFFPCLKHLSARALVVAGFLFALMPLSHAVSIDPGNTNSGTIYTPLDSWSFGDYTNWTSDYGYAPVSFTNLSFSQLGNFQSLVVDTNVPAWLHYNVNETDGTTNFTADAGTIMFWYAPGSWSGTNMGGTGPGEWGRLFEAGAYTTNSSYGWWSIYMDDGGNHLYFSTQTNDLSGTISNYIAMPVAWTTNYFHFIALTYSATNTALYLDGALATNGPPLTVYPGPNALANGFFIGSDSNGMSQAHGLFNDVATFNVPVDAGTIQEIYAGELFYYRINPYNLAMEGFASGDSDPSTSATPDVITGQGNLQSLGGTATCSDGTNAYQVWITNVTTTAAADGSMTVTFAIQGGDSVNYYDVFAGTALTSPLGNAYWTWQGQGQHCQIYSIANLPQGPVFLILGTPQDTDGDGLTDAYERLISHTDPNNAYSNLDGILDGWEILLGLNPQNNNFTSPTTRANYTYNLTDWLDQVSGIRSGSVSLDNEGNVLTVSQ